MASTASLSVPPSESLIAFSVDEVDVQERVAAVRADVDVERAWAGPAR